MFLQAEALAKYQYAYTVCEISRFLFALLFILLFSLDCVFCFAMLFVFWRLCFWLFTSGFVFQANYHCFLFCFVLPLYSMLFALIYFFIFALLFILCCFGLIFVCVLFCFVVLLALLFMLFLAFEFGLIVGLCFVLHFNVAFVSCPCLFMKRVHAFIFGMQECLFSTHYLLWWLRLLWHLDWGAEAVNQAMGSHLLWTMLISCSGRSKLWVCISEYSVIGT